MVGEPRGKGGRGALQLVGGSAEFLCADMGLEQGGQTQFAQGIMNVREGG